MDDCHKPQLCECGMEAKRSFTAEHAQGNVDGLMKENLRYSVTLGVFDEDFAEARRVHPQATWKKFGNSWRPSIRNRAEKVLILKQAKMTEYS